MFVWLRTAIYPTLDLAPQEDLRVLPKKLNNLLAQLTTLVAEMASLLERIDCNSAKPPFVEGLGFKPPEWSKGSCSKRGY